MAPLSKAMQEVLRRAPKDWQRVIPGPTIQALEKRGLVIVRDTPSETGLMASFQWRITATGRVMDGRCPIETRARVVMTGN
jgi:hypothetical protein